MLMKKIQKKSRQNTWFFFPVVTGAVVSIIFLASPVRSVLLGMRFAPVMWRPASLHIGKSKPKNLSLSQAKLHLRTHKTNANDK